MIKQVFFVGAALLATCALAQAQEQARPKHHHKAADAANTEETAAPADDVPLPAAAQKWFGDTVDGILSGADETLNARPATRK